MALTSLPAFRGITFENQLDFQDEAGDAADLTGYTTSSELRMASGKPIVETLTIDDALLSSGSIVISATAAETADWPVGKLRCDVRLESAAGKSFITDQFEIAVSQPVTTS